MGIMKEFMCMQSLLITSEKLQGLMFGYATDETEECMPLTVVLAHAMNRKISDLR